MKKYLYGVDLGGTTTKLGLFSVDGEVLKRFEIPTNKENNGKEILPDIAKAILNHMKENNIQIEEVNGVGIGVPGPVMNGVVNRAVNLGWDVIDVKSELESLLNIPVSVSNDANVAGLGEFWKGGGEGVNNLVFITLGTGVGGGVIVDGKIVDGYAGAGGEFGHAPIVNAVDGITCNCGKPDCLETLASATGVVRLAKKLLEERKDASSLRDIAELHAKDVFDAAKENDEIALAVVEEFGQALGFVSANLAVITNPPVIVFGGGVSKAGQIILDVVKKHFDRYAFHATKDTTAFKLATLENDAGIYGAAYLAKLL